MRAGIVPILASIGYKKGSYSIWAGTVPILASIGYKKGSLNGCYQSSWQIRCIDPSRVDKNSASNTRVSNKIFVNIMMKTLAKSLFYLIHASL